MTSHPLEKDGLISFSPKKLVTDSTASSVSFFANSTLADYISKCYHNDIRDHAAMLQYVDMGSSHYKPLFYARTIPNNALASANSSGAVGAQAKEYYNRVVSRLESLREEEDEAGEPLIEERAISTALDVIDKLQSAQWAPPEVTWHGDDAVVMLWALGDTTYALTVTDGEVGYVVRKGRSTLRIASSINLNQLRLSDLR